MEIKNRNLVIAIGLATLVGGVAAFLTYIESRASRKLQEQVLNLDKQIKELTLLEKKRTV